MSNTSQQGWVAKLELNFSASQSKTFLSKREHIGPLTIQRPFYPEQGLCHLYILHPPGGVVGGDQLSIGIKTNAKSSALITTPGATKIYRSSGNKRSIINQNFYIDSNSTLEWLPMETIIFPGARSKFSTKFSLFGSAKVAAWEIHCLGRPVINESFNTGKLEFSFELWRDESPILLDKLVIDESELENVVGLRGYPVYGTFIISNASKEALDMIRSNQFSGDDCVFGATQIEDIVIIRCLARKTHLVQDFFREIWQKIRPLVFDREASIPRIWAT
mgnify:FL=1|jgi:urease accessory protein|tara:strand:+ start:7573 stop:8400 length:828 start_codon:yes stop_codon:yes gene_type:complete